MRLIWAAASLQVNQNLLNLTGDILEAYPAIASGKSTLVEWLKSNPDPNRLALLDSGAFSAWTKGKQVPLDSYIEFCKKVDKEFSVWVNLDVIPGKWGSIPSAEEVEQSARKGWENFEYMVSKGLPLHRVVHVFHQGERFEWLQKLADLNESQLAKGEEPLYIGLSPANDRTTAQKIMWLDRCMPYITDSKGAPKLKWHGFGVTAIRIMCRYPWYTVDSTSWMRPGTFGQILIPKNPLRFSDGSDIIAVSDRTTLSQGGIHILSFNDKKKQAVIDYLQDLDITLDDVISNDRARHIVNIYYWKMLAAEIDEMSVTWSPIDQGMFI